MRRTGNGGIWMPEQLGGGTRIVGLRQLRRALAANSVKTAYFAMDADPALLDPIRETCRLCGVPARDVSTMAELGRLCGISVGASAAGLLK